MTYSEHFANCCSKWPIINEKKHCNLPYPHLPSIFPLMASLCHVRVSYLINQMKLNIHNNGRLCSNNLKNVKELCLTWRYSIASLTLKVLITLLLIKYCRNHCFTFLFILILLSTLKENIILKPSIDSTHGLLLCKSWWLTISITIQSLPLASGSSNVTLH